MDLNLYDSIIVHLPEQYRDMTDQEQLKYYGSDKMEHCFLYPERNATIRFLTADPSPESSGIIEHMKALQHMYARMAPGFVMGQAAHKRKDDHDFGLLTFKSNALDRDLYNALVVTNLQTKNLLILFSCNLQDVIQLSPSFSKMIDTMAFLPEVTEND